jgi:hypothetical protein
MTEYRQLNFYHDHYTLVDRFQWQKLKTKYGGGPTIKWWQDTAFLQGLKPTEPERQHLKRTKREWTAEEDDYVVKLQGECGDKRWGEKAELFNQKFPTANPDHARKEGDIGKRWREVLKANEISKSQTDQERKRKLTDFDDG